MSFFKKLTQEFENLRTDFADDKPQAPPAGNREYPGYQRPYQEPYQQPYQQPAHQSYGQPYQQPYGQAPPHQQQQAPYGYDSRGPPRSPSGPPIPDSLPPLPNGWITQFDPTSQHYYYVEPSSHRTQWERPLPPGYNIAPQAPAQGRQVGGGQAQRGSGKGGMLLGAAGGLAAGAVGGALLSHALHDSDSDEERHGSYGRPSEETYGYPGVLPARDADGDSVSSSDRESVQEAREEYEEALAEANDSDASSSEEEALEEAREEYEEEYEEAYGDD